MVKILIQAVQILQLTHPKIVLIVTREGKYSEEVKTFSDGIGVKNKVIFTGNVGDPFIPLKMCDMYTHTPLGEGGVSIALFEAMAISKPIIATAVGGIPEAIMDGENGLPVSPDPVEIANKIDFLLSNRTYAEGLGNCAKNSVEEKFTWEQATDIFLQIYANSL
jgi:L-malate glycosyltransferase